MSSCRKMQALCICKSKRVKAAAREAIFAALSLRGFLDKKHLLRYKDERRDRRRRRYFTALYTHKSTSGRVTHTDAHKALLAAHSSQLRKPVLLSSPQLLHTTTSILTQFVFTELIFTGDKHSLHALKKILHKFHTYFSHLKH